MEKLDAVVIGAGVVGLAVARALAMAGREVVILEAEDAIGTHTSSRNSEVIHAGIYYPKGSLKARSCVAGKELLYEYCVAHGVPHRRSGKLIVATDEAQVGELEQIQKKAHANGVTDVVWMTRAQVLALEPELSCVAGLYSPSTGIIDSHALMLAYLGDAEAHGAMLALKSHLLGAQVTADGFVVHSDQMDVACNVLVNSAGLRAPSVARSIEGFSGTSSFRESSMRRATTIRSLGKRAVLAPGLSGARARRTRRARDARSRRPGALRSGRRMGRPHRLRTWTRSAPSASMRRSASTGPACRTAPSRPGYAGIRPKTAGPKEPAPDFEVQGPAVHGVPGLVHLFGIESPGLTSSLALAGLVLDELR